MTPMEKYGKRRQITFRIGEVAQERLARVAELFNLKPSNYAKALLYKDLGIFNEPLDQRRRSWKRQRKTEEEKDNWELPENEAEPSKTRGKGFQSLV